MEPQVAHAARETGPTTGEIGEWALIERIRQQLLAPPPWLVIGVGDDAAVLEPARNRLDVLTTDALVESVHFERRYLDPGDIGRKALAVNLSDLAAMGAEPRAALLSLALPAELPVADCDAIIAGLLALARTHKVTLIGGNISRSPGPLFIDVTATGTVHRRGILRRSGARAGDDLFVSGPVGGAAAGLGWLQWRDRANASASEPDDPELAACVATYRRPEPRVRLGLMWGRNRAVSACIDLSDGLATSVRQLASASGVGAVIDASQLPIAPGARRWFENSGQDPIDAAVRGGEEYELLAAVPMKLRRRYEAASKRAGVSATTRIGTLTHDREVWLQRDGRQERLVGGFAHF